MTRQIGDGDTPPTLYYYVSAKRVRRELIPFKEDGKLAGYRCVTHRADNGPVDGVDTVVADQVEFDNVLIGMNLMRRNPIEDVYAWGWSFLHMDKVFRATRPKEGEPLETLLRFLS